MRVWDIAAKKLCRNHSLGEHRELQAIWSVLIKHKKVYARHPETLSWNGKLKALHHRHEEIIKEFKKGGISAQKFVGEKIFIGLA